MTLGQNVSCLSGCPDFNGVLTRGVLTRGVLTRVVLISEVPSCQGVLISEVS